MTDQEATSLVERAACPDWMSSEVGRRVTNETGCVVSISHITGDIVCQEPGADCDCLVVAKRDDDES